VNLDPAQKSGHTSGPGADPGAAPTGRRAVGSEFGHALLIVGGGRVVTLGLGAVSIVVLTNALVPADFAAFGVVFSLVTLLILPAQFGFRTSIIRSTAASRVAARPEEGRTALTAALVGTTIFAVIIGLAAGAATWWAGWPVRQDVWIAAAIAAWTVAMSLNILTGEWLRGLGDLRAATLLNGLGQFGGLANAAVSCAAFVALAMTDGLTLDRLFGLLVIVALASFAIGLVVGHRRAGSPLLSSQGWRAWREMAPGNLRLMLIQMLQYGVSAQANVLIAGALLAPHELALFVVGTRLMSMLSTALVTVNQASAEMIVRLHAENDLAGLERVLRLGATATFVFAVAGTAALAALTPAGFALIFGPAYADAYAVCLVLLVAATLNIAGGIPGRALMLLGHERAVLKAEVALVAMSIAVCVLGGLYFGIMGLAVGSVIATVIMKTALAWLAWRHVGVRTYAYVAPSAYLSLAAAGIGAARRATTRLAG